MKSAIRKEMEDIFFERTAQSIRNLHWYLTWQYTESAVWVDVKLDFKPEAILDFFNKEFMVYYEEEPSNGTSFGKFGRYLYRAWLLLYNNRPPFQRGGFLAKPMTVGDEETLSSPIRFLSLFDAGLAVDVNRSDYHDGIEATAVRVRLDTAIQFIWDLLERERKASKGINQVQKRLVREQNEFCQLWVYRLISKVKEFGLDWEEASWIATRRAIAKVNDEAFDDDQLEPEWKMVDRWRM
ncbi:uncharacterized protein B0J16DRAFT_324324 [Fusarium flagelliforme]|uniref:uncharacterized protein n=1 Tax=Fusarium flagelliforme TaxID=2675880 RepID=UPI001E8DFF36|nr:uncharacterized protein B0J16DRAFT_324324 [Fusarium flagelliforme]KAH7174865.1 hypothetical protein B0J16DRAFT_324324 [Fusarium flagelliforme]